uniref:CD164 molecule n=1 Tax=Sciurus vulgaris TaxID=55149 RepID=A0A8D2D6H2_SCIVU
MSGFSRRLLWAATCLAVVCVLSADSNSSVTPTEAELHPSATTKVAPTPTPSASLVTHSKTCESHNSCASCLTVNVSNTACFWIECKEDKSYCSNNSAVSNCSVLNNTVFCSGIELKGTQPLSHIPNPILCFIYELLSTLLFAVADFELKILLPQPPGLLGL